MAYTDKLLQCIDCHKTFTFSIAEQEFHASRGFPNMPNRCPPCRQTKKSRNTQDENASEDFDSRKQRFPVVCSSCGKSTRVPFEPRHNEPVYCSDCYVKIRAGK
jgi:CxxC-x17-CxxC domain-containing protein